MATSAVRGPAGNAALAFGIAGLVAFGVLAGIGIAVGEIDALIATVTLVVAAAALVDFRVGAVVLMVLLPLQGNVLFPNKMFGITGINPVNLMLAATLASFMLRGRLAGFVPRPLWWLFIVPILAAGLLGVRHVDDVYPYFYDVEIIHYTEAFGYLRDAAIKPLLIVLIALLVAAAVRQSHKPERFLAPIIVAVWAMALTAIGFVIASGVNLGLLATTAARGFFSAMGMHANDLGRLYAVAYALMLFTWWETKDAALKTVLLATMGVIVVALLLTFSRGAFVGFIVINALFLLWKLNARTFALGIAAAVVAMVILPGFVIARVTLGFDGGGDLNAVSAGRIDGIWLPVLPEIWKSPLWGQGLGSVMWSDAMHKGLMFEVTHPHNAYLEALLDVGALGLGLLVGYFVHVWRNLRALGSNPFLSPEMRGFYQGAAAGLISFFITGFAGSSLAPRPEYSYLWIAIGMMYGQLARRPAG